MAREPAPDWRCGPSLFYVTAGLPLSDRETFFIPEIEELLRQGLQVSVIPIKPGRTMIHSDAAGLAAITIAKPLISLSVIGGALVEFMTSPVRAVRAVRILFKSRSLRILFKNLLVVPKGLWLARAARLRGIDHIHAHWASTSATAAFVAGLVAGVPWSFTAHRWDISEDNLLVEKARSALFVRTIDLQGLREMEVLIEPYRHKLRLIHLGVVRPERARARKEKPHRNFKVLLGARFAEVKGHRYALEAIALLKAAGVEISLHCAGDGPLRSKMEAYSASLGVQELVHFHGLIDHVELLKGMEERRWDAALLPSIVAGKAREGIPVFLIEAMSAGLPVIATETGGISELLADGAGILIPQKDAAAIKNALASLVSDGELRQRLAEKALQRIRDSFSIESTVSAFINELKS